MFDNKSELVHLNSLSFSKFVVLANEEKEINSRTEALRNLANKVANILNELKYESVNIIDFSDKYLLDFA